MTLTAQRQARIERLREMRRSMTLREVSDVEGVTPARIGQLTGRMSPVRTSPLLEVYRFIENYERAFHWPPAIADIAEHFPNSTGGATSTSVVRYWLDKMETLKMITRGEPRSARTLRLLPLDKKIPQIRLMLENEKEKP